MFCFDHFEMRIYKAKHADFSLSVFPCFVQKIILVNKDLCYTCSCFSFFFKKKNN